MTSMIKTSHLYRDGMNEPGYTRLDWSIIFFIFVLVSRILVVKWRWIAIQMSLNKQKTRNNTRAHVTEVFQGNLTLRYGCIQVLTKCHQDSVSLYLLSNVLWYWLHLKAQVKAYLFPAEPPQWKGSQPFPFIPEQSFDWVTFEQLFSCAPPWTNCSI